MATLLFAVQILHNCQISTFVILLHAKVIFDFYAWQLCQILSNARFKIWISETSKLEV